MGSMVDLGGVTAYRAEPVGLPRAGLVLIHEIWGLVPHIRDVADRYAAQGFLVLAPDLLSDAGITPEVGAGLEALRAEPDEEARLAGQALFRERTAPLHEPGFAEEAVGRLRRVVDALAAEPGIGGRIAVTGFCFGGTYTFALAAADPRVRAAAPFYGIAPEEVGAISCPVLAIYGEDDRRVVATLPEARRRLAEGGVEVEELVYPGARHAFFNDTNAAAYDPEAAADAWRRVLAFLADTVAGPVPSTA